MSADSIEALVSRRETELNLNWGRENPALFVEAVAKFQEQHPVTDWKHHVDLGRNGFLTLIATRREKPFESVQAYLADDHLYLNEIGMGR
jgi:hypothetical protein